MKKSNWILLVVGVVLSVFFLWTWYYLSFDQIDAPLDLFLSIIWWAVLVLGIFAIWRIEQARRKRIRTIYVGSKAFFNAEAGIVPFASKQSFIDEVEKALNDLNYNFRLEDYPEEEELSFGYIIRTDVYKEQDEDEQPSEQAADVEFVVDEPVASQEETFARIAEKEQENESDWEGAVIISRTKEKLPFESKTELLGILEEIGLPEDVNEEKIQFSPSPRMNAIGSRL